MKLENKNIGFALTGSFNMVSKSIKILKELAKIKNIHIIPIMSFNAYNLDTRFGYTKDLIKEIETITKNKIINKIVEAEKQKFDILIIAPCTGNTISKLAVDIIDTPVTMAVKSHLQYEKPIVIGISTYNALSGNAENIGKILNRKHYFFVPFKQSNPITKPRGIIYDSKYIKKTLELALEEKQIQPIILGL